MNTNENSAHSFTEGSDSGTLKFSNPVSPVKEETKHTPLLDLWEVREGEHHTERNPELFVTDSMGVVIAEVNYSRRIEAITIAPEYCRKNAELLASAPELLTAVKYAYACLDKCQYNTGDLGDQAYQTLKDVLTKLGKL